jgi:hypothetical protein
MLNKKTFLMIIVIVASIVGYRFNITGKIGISNFFKKDANNITVMTYSPATKVHTSGFQFDKYEKVETVAWLNNGEVLTIAKKNVLVNPDSSTINRYCSIYNPDTNITKEFKDVNIGTYFGVSPNKEQVLYEKPKYIPKIQGAEWKAASDSGELFHREIEILNLTTSQITTLKTEYNNSNAEYVWLSDSRILINYSYGWSIIDITGNVYAEGSYKTDKMNTYRRLTGTDLKDLEADVSGKIYYSQHEKGKAGTEVVSLDVKTKEVKSIFYNKNSIHAIRQGKTILIDYHVDNSEISPGLFDRSFGVYAIDENGKIKLDIKLSTPCAKFLLSPDGGKAAYIERTTPLDTNGILKVIDTHTGEITEVGKVDSKEVTKDSFISNVCWNNTGTALSFTSGDSSYLYNGIPEKIVVDSFKHGLDGDTNKQIDFEAVKPTEISTYIIYFE